MNGRRSPAPAARAISRLFTTLGMVTGVLAGGGLFGCGFENQAACLDYLDALNAARQQCGLVQLEADAVCPASLNHSADCVDFYQRMQTSVTCDLEDNTVKINPDLNDTTVAEPPGCF